MDKVFLLFLALAACSGAPTSSPQSPDQGLYAHQEILESSLRFRRPPGAGADPRVSPGGKDYYGTKTPAAVFDCETPARVFQNAQLTAAAFSCVTSIASPMEVTYRLIRDVSPYWQIEDEPETPPCLVSDLRRIPVPRELVFQARTRGANNAFEPTDCFVSRLEIEKDKILDIRVPILGKTRLVLKFPVKIGSESEWNQKLTAWAIAPFVNDGMVTGKLFPSPLCRKCLGEDAIVAEKDYGKQRRWKFSD